jgi:membrane fusion protein (multidrug efflux system)
LKVTDKKKTLRRGVRRIAVGIGFLLFLAAASGGYWFYFIRGVVFSDDARLDGDLVDMAPQISGRLTEVRGKEGARVRAEEILFVLEKRELTAALARAEANEKSARADLLMAEAEYSKTLRGPRPEEIRMAEAAEQKAATSLKLARENWGRIKRLHSQKAVSTSELDRVQTAYEEAVKVHEAALNQLIILRQGSRREDLEVARANVESKKARLAGAQAAFRQARVNLDFTEVRAPFDGVIVRKWESPGAMVQAGKPVLTLFNPDTLHVAANIEEKNLGEIAVGDAVDISVDAYPDLNLRGKVEKVLPATNSEFSLIPAEGVSGTYIKVAQRVPIRIAVNCPPHLNLGPGISVEVYIHSTGNRLSSHE